MLKNSGKMALPTMVPVAQWFVPRAMSTRDGSLAIGNDRAVLLPAQKWEARVDLWATGGGRICHITFASAVLQNLAERIIEQEESVTVTVTLGEKATALCMGGVSCEIGRFPCRVRI